MGGEFSLWDESAEIDDLVTLDPSREAAGAFGFALLEVASGSHGVKQVVGGVQVFRNGGEVSEKIAFEQNELFVVEELLELRGWEAGNGAHDSCHGVAGFQKSREQAHADVSIGASEKNVHSGLQSNHKWEKGKRLLALGRVEGEQLEDGISEIEEVVPPLKEEAGELDLA